MKKDEGLESVSQFLSMLSKIDEEKGLYEVLEYIVSSLFINKEDGSENLNAFVFNLTVLKSYINMRLKYGSEGNIRTIVIGMAEQVHGLIQSSINEQREL